MATIAHTSSRHSASSGTGSAREAVDTAGLAPPVDLQRALVVRERLSIDLHGLRRPPHLEACEAYTGQWVVSGRAGAWIGT